MSFHRGATITTSASLGYAETSDVGPTAGNGFYKRWPDDLAMLQDVGITDIRLTLDWARLQPKPGTLDADWVERYEQFIAAADAIDVRVWATMFEGAVPRWFDNEGGVDDDEAVTTWWPRWVERVADRFGDLLHGWVPMHCLPLDLPARAWDDTWSILRGESPVVASIDVPDGVDSVARFAASADVVGMVLASVPADEPVDDRRLDGAAEHWGEAIRAVHDAAGSRPLAVAQFTPDHDGAEQAARIVERFVDTLDEAIADGCPIETCFLDPAIAAPDTPIGLLDTDRSPTPAAARYLATS